MAELVPAWLFSVPADVTMYQKCVAWLRYVFHGCSLRRAGWGWTRQRSRSGAPAFFLRPPHGRWGRPAIRGHSSPLRQDAGRTGRNPGPARVPLTNLPTPDLYRSPRSTKAQRASSKAASRRCCASSLATQVRAKRLVAFMRVTNSLAPLQWMALQMGCELVVRDAQAARIAELQAELQQLTRGAA